MYKKMKSLNIDSTDDFKQSKFSLWRENFPYTKLGKALRPLKRKIERYITDPWYSFKYGVKNLYRWFWVIWKDRNWDYVSIYNVLEHKLHLLRTTLIKNDFIADIDIVARDMQICINLIKKIKEEFYNFEYLDYHKTKFEFEKIEGSTNSRLNMDIISERFDDYLKKYPSSVRFVMKEYKDRLTQEDGTLNKKLLSMWVGDHNQEKAKRLLFNILDEKIDSFWD